MTTHKKTRAFTIAEVLITLGIIGIVAAVTIPQLIKNYRHYVLENQFKKAYSIMQQVTQTARYDLGVDSLYKYCTVYQGTEDDGSYINSQQCHAALNKAFVKETTKSTWAKGEHSITRKKNSIRTFNNKNVVKEDTGLAGFAALWVMRQAQDGILANFRIVGWQIRINLDTNGLKGPNQLGHDVFIFTINNKKDMLTGIKQEKKYTDEELDNMEFEEEYQKALAGLPCNIDSGSAANGVGCSWFAINDINPETGKRGYWKNLP